jgi:CheY-like chemotaxis protein
MTKKKTILVIDDEPGVCSSIELILEDYYQVSITNTAQAGLDFLKNNLPIDLVLLDIKMPGMDGLTAVAKIKKLQPQTKIVIVTAGRNEDLQQRIKELAIEGYILKPFALQSFLTQINEILS